MLSSMKLKKVGGNRFGVHGAVGKRLTIKVGPPGVRGAYFGVKMV